MTRDKMTAKKNFFWSPFRKIISQVALPEVRAVFKTYVWPNKRILGVAFLFMILFALLEAASVKILEPIFNEVFIDKNKEIMYILALQIILLFAFKGFASYMQSICMAKLGLTMVKNMQNDLFRKLVYQDVAFLASNNSSGVLMHFMSDMFAIKDAVLNGFTTFVKDSFTVIFLVALMFWKSPEMAAAIFIVFPLGVYPAVYFGRKAKQFFLSQQISGGKLFGTIAQVLQNIKIVKSYQLEKAEIIDVEKNSSNIADLSFKLAKTTGIASPLMEFLGGIAIAATLVYGGWKISQGTLTTGAFMVFLLAIVAAYKPMKNLAYLNIRVQIGVAAIGRIFNLMNQETTIKDAPDAIDLHLTKGDILFKNLTFGYTPDCPVLHNVTLKIEAGQTVAIVGLAGAGKSSLINLLQRFYEVQAGEIYIDSQEIRSVTLDSLHKNMAFVSQDVVLFEGTILYNIQIGRPEATEEEVIVAAEKCGAHDFIMNQPQGYQTQVGERGGNLSGGQKQLVSIARALLKNAPIILLDEPTSSLDSNSENMVKKGLKELTKGRSTLIIAHRLSTIRDADTIYVMEGGRVIETGAHQELLTQNGRYAHLYKLQHVPGAGN